MYIIYLIYMNCDLCGDLITQELSVQSKDGKIAPCNIIRFNGKQYSLCDSCTSFIIVDWLVVMNAVETQDKFKDLNFKLIKRRALEHKKAFNFDQKAHFVVTQVDEVDDDGKKE